MKTAREKSWAYSQLINCKRNPKAQLNDSSACAVGAPVSGTCGAAGIVAASQAAVRMRSRLYQEIEDLFDGFVNAAVQAIEQRDPTTSGHSQRVCE